MCILEVTPLQTAGLWSCVQALWDWLCLPYVQEIFPWGLCVDKAMLWFTPAALLISVFLSHPMYILPRDILIQSTQLELEPQISALPWALKLPGHGVRLGHSLHFNARDLMFQQHRQNEGFHLPSLLSSSSVPKTLSWKEKNSGICTVSCWYHELLLSPWGRIYSHPLWKRQGLHPPASSKRLRKLSASALKGCLCVGARWGYWLRVGAWSEGGHFLLFGVPSRWLCTFTQKLMCWLLLVLF